MILEYKKYCNLQQLLTELNNINVLVEGNQDLTVLTLLDENIDINLIDKVVTNHIPLKEILPLDWEGLEQYITSSKPFMRVYMECKSRSELAPIYALIMDCITSSRNLNTLSFALSDLNNSISGGFSIEEMNIINNALSINHFPLALTILPTTPNVFIPPPNWEILEASLSDSSIFYRVYAASKTSTVINTIMTLLQDTITSSRKVESLHFVLNDLKSSLIPELTNEELLFINNLLINNNFPFTI